MLESFAADRSAFIASLNATLARDPQGAAVVRIDLDRFSRIRQMFGADVASTVRESVIRRLTEPLGAQVLAFAEDSFAVIVRAEDPSLDGLELLGMRFVEAVSGPVQLPGLPDIAVGSNAGVAAAAQFADVDAPRLIAGAEHAVQQAAGLGSRRVIVYQAAHADDPTRIPELYADMLGAVQAGQFVPYLQPIVRLPSLEVTGAEALVRWNHPTHGVLPPSDFLDEAERSGLIRDIDATIWQQAWSAFAAIPTRHALTISVNLSAADLDFPGLMEKVEQHLRTSGLPPAQLAFEVTETALSLDWKHARRRLASLKALGCTIAVDDFGSGHMFLERLATGLFDAIKLDRSLASRDREGRRFQLLAGVTSLARNLGMRVIAEGVETQEQLALVIEAGCDAAQGYLFGKPMPSIEFAQRVAGS